MTIEQPIHTEEKSWFYEKNGQRIGGVSEQEIIELIKNQAITYGATVWKTGFPDWMMIENTELRCHLEKSAPPPLTGHQVNNTLVWLLAFAPIIGLALEYFVSGVMHSDSEYLTQSAAENGDYWYITLILNIALCVWDARRLKTAGINTTTFRGWRWLVPVYLFQRAKMLKQNQAYFIIWIICFFITLTSRGA